MDSFERFEVVELDRHKLTSIKDEYHSRSLRVLLTDFQSLPF